LVVESLNAVVGADRFVDTLVVVDLAELLLAAA